MGAGGGGGADQQQDQVHILPVEPPPLSDRAHIFEATHMTPGKVYGI